LPGLRLAAGIFNPGKEKISMIANASETPAYKLTCITPGCEAKQYSRGVCQTCYQVAHRLMHEGKATDEQLVALGMLLPRKYRTGAGKFLLEFEKRQGEQQPEPKARSKAKAKK
jgi:hypothetical protein